MSLKDLNSINHIDTLKKIGVSSLKIEGRMKGASYVATVVGIYRKYLDSGIIPSREDIEKLDRIFYRGGQTDGYLIGKIGKDMFCFNKPDNPYEKQNEKIEEVCVNQKKMGLTVTADFTEGKIPEITVLDDEIKVVCKGSDVLAKGENKIADEESIKVKLNKTGGTPYEFENVSVKIGGKPFVPVSLVNELRRNALFEYESEFLKRTRRKAEYSLPIIEEKERGGAVFTCRVGNVEQFKAALSFDFEYFYVPQNVLSDNYEEFSEYKDKIIIETPVIVKDGEKEKNILKRLKEYGFNKLWVNNICFADNEDFILYGGMRLNVFNSHTLAFLKEKGFKTTTLSTELNLGAIRDLKKPLTVETMVYGHLPLMITENCVIKNNNACPCNGEVNYLTDRKGIKFPVVRDGESHRSVVLNSLPLFMGDKLDEIARSGAEQFLMYFTVENPQKVKTVCRAYFDKTEFDEQYTRLHYSKGVL